MSKPKIIKDFDKIGDEVLALIKLEYPHGFDKKLIQFKNKEGKLVSALPFETETHYYLIRMTRKEASHIVDNDEDYDEFGKLTDEAKERLTDELSDISEDE